MLQPYRYMDLAEEELKNLIIVDTSDNVTKTMRVDRRDKKIQKDFFSSMEYLIWGVNVVFEQKYYEKKRRKGFSWKNAVLLS